ncbi:hypothetical protein SRHO_G00252100 [Serrasalmus rhombeus]
MSYMYYLNCSEHLFTREEHVNLIRTSIFHITAVCGGLPAVVWALHVLYHHHKSGGRISAISIFLILSDLLELIVNSVIEVVFMLGRHYIINCDLAFDLMSGIRFCGYHLHQMLALENILYLRYPSLSYVVCPLCSTVLCITVVLLETVLISLGDATLMINTALSLFSLIVLIFTCLLTCRASSDHVLPTKTKLSVFIRNVAMFTFIFIYFPFILYDVKYQIHHLVNLRVMADPLLCVLICKINFWVQKAQEHSEQSDAP